MSETHSTCAVCGRAYTPENGVMPVHRVQTGKRKRKVCKGSLKEGK